MGRLTLNVLSFAQFEREVTGERIRDKIAASKQKGMWMGGNVPLGYDASGRMLVLNPAEAETVRRIFALYRELGYVRRVKAAIDQLGFRTKRSMTADGTERGDKPFSRGHIYRLLANPIYTGQIAHKGQLYPGQHPALIDTEMWTAVQDQLAVKARRHRSKVDAAEPSLLTPWEVVRFPAIAETDEVHKIETIWDRGPIFAGRARPCIPSASRLIPSIASAGRSANTILPVSISNPRHPWAAAWSSGNGSRATTRRICRNASTRSCRAGILPTR